MTACAVPPDATNTSRLPVESLRSGYRHIELFAGAGGLSIGCKLAGFPAAHYYEADKHACSTLKHNIDAGTTLAGAVHQCKVEDVDWDDVQGPVRLLAGGAPCQPFSLAGRHLAWKDGRNLFPEVFKAVRALNPGALLLENVRGLMRPDFAPYFEYVLAQAADPSIAPASPTELWQDHFARIKRHQASRGYKPEYHVRSRVVNAADFGVPQLRFRVFIVATRFDFGPYEFPKASHSRDALVRAQRTREYWEARGVRKPRQLPTAEFELDLADEDDRQPWVTVRDALAGLGPAAPCEDACENNHWAIPGARSYHGHRGSSLDLPSKTIKAGVHGVPGGENCLVDAKGRFRYYTLREAARIQTFPDEHRFLGSRTSVTKQIGNAVPCELARAIARPLFTLLESSARADMTTRRGQR